MAKWSGDRFAICILHRPGSALKKAKNSQRSVIFVLFILSFMPMKALSFFFIFSLFLLKGVLASYPSRFPDSIGTMLSQAKDLKIEIEILLKAADRLKASDPDQAFAYAKLADSLAGSTPYHALQLKAMIQIGNLETAKTQFVAGMSMAMKARDLATILDDKKALGETWLIMGQIRIFQGIYSESYESYFNALRLFEEFNDKEGIIKSLNGIGNICYYQKNFSKAFIYYSKALNLARELHDTIQVGNVLNNIGIVLLERGEIAGAIDNYNQAIVINTRFDQKVRLGTNYLNLGIAYMKINRFDDFVKNNNKAIDIYTVTGSNYNRAICYLNFCDFYKMLKQTDHQVQYAMLAYSEGLKFNMRDVIFQSAEILHEYYLKSGQIDSAYKFSNIQHNEKDSIDSEKSSARLTLLEQEYSYEKAKKEEKMQQQKKDYIAIILIILAISGLITTSLFWSRQVVKTKNILLEKQRLADEIEYKNKELTVNVMSLIKKNEMSIDISNRLIQLEQRATDPVMKQEILRLVNSMQRNSSTDIWEEFETRFRQVHNSFYDKLLSRFPDLSPSELKLCALLRLNLTTKEICELSGQRPASLDVARYRLRKKLGLANSQVNLVTFLSQV